MDDLSKSILGAALILGIAIYAAGEPRYDVSAAGNGAVYVLDQSSGNLRWCYATQCSDVK